ncbi:MAG: DUF47 family protein [Candidatus Portnoybacteria bacterium]|nr:DUF47 family protein [Candidatus Portnoybacteria bacterium]
MGKLETLFRGKERALFEGFSQFGNSLELAGLTFLNLTRDLERGEDHAARLHDIEHTCDEVAQNLHAILDDTTFLPFEHEDLAKLINHADDIVDLLWGAANRIANLYRLKNPDPELVQIAEIIAAMTSDIKTLFINLKRIKRLKNFKETVIDPFRAKEGRGDELRDAISMRWYEAAIKNPAITPLKDAWAEVFQHLEHSTDKGVDITDVLNRLRRQ